MNKNEKDEQFAKLPQCAIDFIELIIKKMGYRKKARAEVMAELTAHFEDELRNCTTNEERQHKAQQLIAEFGDAKLLAVLLRRAKKRCRPLWKTIIARTFQSIGVLILCLIIYIAWFLSGKPVITTDYIAQLNHIVRPAANQSLNAAPYYHQAAKTFENLPKDIYELLSKTYNQATPEQKQIIKKWLTNNKQTFDLITTGSQKPYYWQKYEGKEMVSVLMPVLGNFRGMARALRWRAWLNAEKARYQDTFKDIITCYRLGQHLRGDKLYIEQLVGIALQAIAIDTLYGILSDHYIDSATLAKLQQDLEQAIADESFAISFEVEKLCIYDEIQRCFTEDGIIKGHISLEGFKRLSTFRQQPLVYYLFDEFWSNWTKPLQILFTHPDRQETREMADRYFAFLEKVAAKTPAQIHAEGINVEKEATEIIKGNILLEFLACGFSRIIQYRYRQKVDTQAVLAVIALLRYRQDTGAYPQNLDELITAKYLKELPIDPYSDKPLVYRKTNDNFILYSVGLNFIDDGGKVFRDKKGRVKKWSDKRDLVFWPVPK